MENTTETTAAPVPAKTTRASRKKNPKHQTHGALTPPVAESMNMIKAFGIRDGYDTDSLDEYKEKINEMTTTDLHEHAHTIGIVPLDARDKLIVSLERRFVEAKMSQRGPRRIQVKTNPAMADFMKKFNAGEA